MNSISGRLPIFCLISIALPIAFIDPSRAAAEAASYVTVHDRRYDPQEKQQQEDLDYYEPFRHNNLTHRTAIDDRIYQYYAGPISGPVSSDDYAEFAAGQTDNAQRRDEHNYHYHYYQQQRQYHYHYSWPECLKSGRCKRGLFPNIFNLASNAIISVNGTCGQKGPESFCKLVEHVYNRQPQCDICDDLNPQKRHPIEYAVDGTSRWWQSPSLATGLKYEWVTITLDLRQQYQVAYVVLKAAISPRPGNWILERSLDGVTYRPWQYYAVNDEECDRVYGIPAARGIPKFARDDTVICTSLYSRLDPLENGEIHTSLVNGRPGVDGPSETLQDFTKARYVRFRFQRLRTLNSDLVFVTHGHIDKSVTRRYYYAIRDISIGGQCICYGHAEHCPVDPTTGQMRCECKHNTTGESCKECLPLYNQRPWRSGTSTNPNSCEPCQCFNHADRCSYDFEIEKQRLSLTPDGIYEGGGVCVDCRDNTQGVNCQECKLNYFRPAGISPYAADACRPCQCDPTGSLDGSCVKDEKFARDDLKPGDCYCKPGFGGGRCDRCDIGYRNYPTCDPCPCNRAGSANFAYCGDTCICKKNVEGAFCDRCKAGTFNLDEDNRDGCTPCFCFGMTDRCRGLDWEKTQVRDFRGWHLTDMEGRKSVSLPINATSDIALTLNVREIPDRSLVYWSAPKAYVGNLLTSYGGYLAYFVYVVAESSGTNVQLPDVILKGEGSSSVEYYSRQEFRERENVSVRIRFTDNGAWYDSQSRRPADKLQLMSALASVKSLMIRSTYHQNQVQASIYGVALDSANRNGIDRNERMSSVEQCECPATFTGLSCEGCLDGYRRVNNVLQNGKCELCVCHGHAFGCDAYSGNCLDCQHNTTGARCEHCLRGYYGAPALGGDRGGCRQCGCPLTDVGNNFSPTCGANKHGVSAADTDYVCTACQNGYIGNKCEMCADGFFGDPTTIGGTCRPCSCSGNIDQAAIGNCDRKTGLCLKCIGNTDGEKCERCKAQFFGDAMRHDCRACGCNAYGAVSPNCNNRTGDCECKPNYVGMQCDRCKEGHGDIENGCPPCQCNVTGSHSDRCDALSGQCQCKPGVFGKRCDSCLTGYFGFSHSGCQFCGCYALGSVENGKCDVVTGQCMCRPHVSGQRCTLCQDGYYNITSGEGCQSCDCHKEGSDSTVCDQQSGQCRCKSGVTGVRCDKCAPNYYGLSNDGCKKCPVCPALGHVCDPVTGQCVCPPHTVGDMCESCAENTWNYHPLKGCEPCQCNSGGSAGPSCDRVTGACVCRDGYTGRQCDLCTHGHFGFPACRRCRCHEFGTDPRQCQVEKGCSCDDQGQCPCKKNVRGQKCRDCTPTSFSLEGSNPNGCTECFCFNRTNFCIQSSYVWQQINPPNRHAFFVQPWVYYERLHGLHVFPNEPATLNSYPTDQTPIYWPLPGPFVGDKVTSYNGHLRFQIANTNGNYLEGPARPDERLFEYYPLVVLIGNHRVILEHYKTRSEIAESGNYVVKLREDFWKARHHKEVPVTRQMMMVALQNVQAIYIRGTFIERASEASLSSVSMDAAVWDNSTAALFSNNTAVGVEACDCPTGYAGISCQNPADGYCRKKKPNYLDSENDLDLMGNAELCACHGHTRTCDRETCKCTNCDHNTAGDFCEHCDAGYYGEAKTGTADDCKKCACPLEENSFSATCRAVPSQPNGKGYVCDRCQEGYTGHFCESCVERFFGDPTQFGGSCKPCDCNRDGSLSDTCDPRTGQCQCRSGVTGRTCSECRPRYALTGRECQSCDAGCTRDLMTDVDELDAAIGAYNFTGLVPAPWGRLASIENRTLDMERRSQDIKKGETEARDMLKTLGSVKKPLMDADKVQKDLGYVKERLEKSEEKMKRFPSEGERLITDIQKALTKAKQLTQSLSRYHVGGGLNRTATSGDVNRWVDEATTLLAEMQNRTEYLEKRFNRAELELSRAKELLHEVMNRKFNDTTFELLGRRIENLTKILEDARNIAWDTIRQRLHEAESVTATDKKMIAQYDEYLMNIKELNATAVDLIHDSKDKVQGAKMHLLNIHDDYTESNFTLLRQIENLTIECEALANQLANLLPEYQHQWVEPAMSYARLLESNAEAMKNAFVHTRNASQWAVKAAQAYQEIEGALVNASLAAVAARNASHRIDQADRDFLARADTSSGRSVDLLREAKALNVTGLRDSLKRQNMSLGDVDERLNANKKEHFEATKRFDQFDTMNDRVQAVTEQAKKILGQSQDADRKTKEVVQNVQELNSKVQELVASTGKGILNITDRVKQSLDGVKKARQDLEKVKVQAAENDDKVEDLTRKLLLLKEKIAVARGKASQIKLSVKSKDDGVCSRSYVSPAVPSPINNIHLEYKPTNDVRNASIFMTQTEQSRTRQSEYLAVELRGQRIVFLWNVGGGDRMVTNLMRIDPIPEKSLRTWYHIDIERRGNSATLNVSLVPNGKPPTDVSKISYDGGGESLIFNTIPGSTVISLGVPSSTSTGQGGVSRIARYRVPLEGSPQHFYGNIGDIKMDGTKLSLWNYVHDSGQCLASFAEVDEPENGLSKSFLFDDGFAQIAASPYGYDSKSSNIQIVFATYSENGLIYFRGNPNDKDFVSIELADGQIVFQFYLGGNSKLRLTSKNAYNDGKFHTVVARRHLTNGSLSVNGDVDFVTELTPGQLVDLNVRASEHYVGGVPLSFNKSIWNQYGINWEGFYGCVVKLTPAQGEELDVSTAIQTLNVKPNCIQQSDRFVLSNRPISFAGDGLFVVAGLQLDPVSVVAFNFRTAAAEGVLLYQSSRLSTRRRRDTKGKGFYVIYLTGGRVYARIGQDAGGTNVILQSTSSTAFNDGRWHTVVLKRNFKEIGLYVDDVLGQKSNLKQGDEVIVSRDGQLFMGGVGRSQFPSEEMPAYHAYSGCISDVFLNYERVNLLPQKQDNAYLGQCNATLYQVTTTGGVLAEEPLLSDGEDVVVADESFEPRQADQEDLGTSERKKSKFVFEAPIALEEQEQRNLNEAHPPDDGTVTVEPIETQSPTAEIEPTTVAPIITCARSSYLTPIAAGALYGVTGDTFNRFRMPAKFDTSDLSFWIEFRTDQPNGVLLAWPNKNWRNYFLIVLENGVVVLKTKSSRTPIEATGSSTAGVNLADARWHTISVIKKKRQISMEIDGRDNQIIKGAPEKPNLKMKGGLVIGGVPKTLTRHSNTTFSNLVGCIRNFTINNEIQKLVGVKTQRGVYPCYEQQSPGLYLPGDGFVRFDKGTELGLSVVELGFRSDNTSEAILMMATIPYAEAGYFSIELHNGQARAIIKPPGNGGVGGQVSIIQSVTPTPLCDNNWHRIRVEIIGLKFSLRVDDEPTKVGTLSKEILSFLLNVPVYFGGLEQSIQNQDSLQLPSKSFRGCLREVSINGVQVVWNEAALRKKAVVNGCPFPE